jgi:tRNA-specific 2-thiouridylase
MVKSNKKTVYLGMSGGVDSSVSAYLLQKQDYRVVGVYMKNWSKNLPGMQCPWAEDLADAKRVATRLGIDFKVFDFENEYKDKVVDYMISEYKAGRTPNPDIMCNQEIKFQLFAQMAFSEGADLIATGHYARIVSAAGSCLAPSLNPQSIKAPGCSENSSKLTSCNCCSDKPDCNLCSSESCPALPPESESLESIHPGGPPSRVTPCAGTEASEKCFLARPKDKNKDQTYFLYRAPKEALSRTIFPLAELEKPEVKKIAEDLGLSVAGKKESMGVCFVGEVDIRDFLKQYLEVNPGEIRDELTGEVLGNHEGVYFYTIGQRHGLNLGGGLPYYVSKKDLGKNVLFVTKNLNNEQIWQKETRLTDVILEKDVDYGQILVRTRHRGELISAKFVPETGILTFEQEQRSLSSGQSIVFYDGETSEVVVGGGIIV